MLTKHTDKHKACPYDAYGISIFGAGVGLYLTALCSGGHGNPPDSGTLLSAYADISPDRGIVRPYGVAQIYTLCEFVCTASDF